MAGASLSRTLAAEDGHRRDPVTQKVGKMNKWLAVFLGTIPTSEFRGQMG